MEFEERKEYVCPFQNLPDEIFNFAFIVQVVPLRCTRYCVAMQNLAFYPINKIQMRSCLHMPWKDQQKHGRVLF